MLDEFIALIDSIGQTVFKLVPVSIALGVVFAVAVLLLRLRRD